MKEIYKNSESNRTELEKFEKEEIQSREKLKHLQGKHKKLKKGIQQVFDYISEIKDCNSLSEHQSWLENFEMDIQKTEGNLGDLTGRLATEEAKLETIRESLKGL